jgi:transposase
MTGGLACFKPLPPESRLKGVVPYGKAVLDNTRYQRCTRVQQWAEELRIELLYLPAYSPHLNRIERLWKFVKKECLSCRYFEDFARFKAAIVESLEGVEGKPRTAIKSLLTLTFQTFEKPQLLAG